MPKWLKGIVAPTLMLWLYAIAVGIASGLFLGRGPLPTLADFASRVALSLVISSWVVADAQKRRRGLCYDYDSFVYFAWPIVVPIYLFQTRGVRAFLTLLCFAGISLVAALVALAVSFLRGLL
jgi:hypothetical protein